MSERKKYRRTPDAEIDERVEFVADLLAKAKRRNEIHKLCIEKWGVHWRTVENYTVRAREMLRKQSDMSKDDAKELGVSILLDVVRNPSSQRLAMLAEERLAEIFGYNAPKQTEISGRDGKPISYELTPEQRKQRLDEIFGRVAKQNNGNGNGHADKPECLIPPRN